MSRKKKKLRIESRQAEVKPEIPIEDDPYWKVSGIYMDAHRIGHFLTRFERFDDMHPEWTDNLMDGMPTYYCILGVKKGATEEEIDQAYEKKLEFSSYPNDIIEEAYDALIDPELQKEYDELLFLFEQVTKNMRPSEKNELIKEHSSRVNVEKDFIRFGRILNNYKDFHILYTAGMPDLYEIAGFAKDSTTEQIKKYCETDSEFVRKICTVLGDPASRDNYNFLIYFTHKYGRKENLERMEAHRKKWKKIERSLLEKITLMVLDEPGAFGKYMRRVESILNTNQDWKKYIPPNKETFLSILGLDRNSLQGDKKEIETAIREKYRYLEKTAQVNLAYSVLKNTALRNDYLWLLDNHEISNALAILFREEEEVSQEIKKPKKVKKAKKAKQEMPSFEEILSALARSILEKRKASGGAKKKKNKIPDTQTTFDDILEE